MTADKNPLLTLTDAAVNRVKSIMDNANSEVIGLRIGIKTAGCSGMKYNVEYHNINSPIKSNYSYVSFCGIIINI